MRRPSLQLIVLLLAAFASVARADGPDLSGPWQSEDGPVTMNGTFDGAHVVVERRESPGLALGLDPTASATTETRRAYTFSRRDRYDWLTAPGAAPFFQKRAKDRGLNGPWRPGSSDSVKITDRMIEALFADLMDLGGNANHVADKGDPSPSFTVKEKWTVLVRFQHSCEKEWGRPVTTLARSDFASGAIFDFFSAQKAVALARYHRTPAEVIDRFITIDGSIEGATIAQRKLLTQYWAPIGADSGVVGAFTPGFENSARVDMEQANLANQRGVGMFLLDPQWTYTAQGAHHLGGIDSGQGIARDSLGFASWAKATTPTKKLFLIGHSMGAGSGTLGMMTVVATGAGWVAVDDGAHHIEGSAIVPKDTPLVCQSAYLEMTPTRTNRIVRALAYVPLVRTHRFREHDDGRMAFVTGEDGIVAQPEAQVAANGFIADTLEKLDMGVAPRGPVFLIHSKDDDLARFKAVQRVHDHLVRLGRRVQLRTFDSSNHEVDMDPVQERAFLDFLPEVVKGAR